jgi:serine protease Do
MKLFKYNSKFKKENTGQQQAQNPIGTPSPNNSAETYPQYTQINGLPNSRPLQNTTHPKQTKTLSLKSTLLISISSAFLFSSLAILASWQLFNSSKTQTTISEQREIISSEGEIFNEIASEVGKSVVSIVVAGNNGQSAAGTGVIINSDGLILTNKHVIPVAATEINVVDYSNRKYSASVLGRDSANDIAFIKVEGLPASVPPAKLADSSRVKVGDKVLAIGNALGEFQNTVTSGIVSGIGRPIEISDENGESFESLFNLIQTDAAINPGNSGGPLVNMNGEVIGINTAIVRDAQGLGFSIPINDAKALIAQVEQNGNLGERAYLGVRYVNLTDSISEDLNLQVKEGALVYDARGQAIELNSPAATAGLRQYDVILQVNEVKLSRSNSLAYVLSGFKPGDTISLTILRDGQTLSLNIVLGSTPSN